ncbi:predicted protein [Histoplasma mississippiense (nom. inval.)]|uniref:predicted protein n=1 Tax=Ajellomyces capsulatus (strain NAm1 / WU24) TaxID=2059318 RepID=UPI000157C814|nr:predicted protein [Histoplasma mississippiense (nom. inval.)]EDN09383.1 predicted protein [Histoplasma mississippiense (nom. inval.)]
MITIINDTSKIFVWFDICRITEYQDTSFFVCVQELVSACVRVCNKDRLGKLQRPRELYNPPGLFANPPKFGTLQDAFPHAKFVFPAAPLRRPQQHDSDLISQWFDLWWLPSSSSPTDDNSDRPFPLARDSLQSSGLQDSTQFLHDLLQREISLVEGGAKNVLLGGLSQGCATSIVACLLWDGIGEGGEKSEVLGALVGFCGRLPFERRIRRILTGGRGEDDQTIEGERLNQLSSTDGESEIKSKNGSDVVGNAIDFFRGEFKIPRPPQLPSSSQGFLFQQTPLFLGHGVEDMTVPIRLGREAVACVEALGMHVSWNDSSFGLQTERIKGPKTNIDLKRGQKDKNLAPFPSGRKNPEEYLRFDLAMTMIRCPNLQELYPTQRPNMHDFFSNAIQIKDLNTTFAFLRDQEAGSWAFGPAAR